jgi:hypothetical protein
MRKKNEKKFDPAKYNFFGIYVANMSKEELEQLCCYLLTVIGHANEFLTDAQTILMDGPEAILDEIADTLERK